jgi:hypothetical protein
VKLKSNWRTVLRHAWSVRLAALAVLLSGAEVAMSCLAGSPPISAGWFAALSGTVTIAAAVARFVSQKALPEVGE